VRRHLEVDPREVQFSAVRAQGAGGQNVNKVSSAAHLRFDIRASSLPDDVKDRLLALPDQRIGADGVVVIKAREHRSLPLNRAAALARLQALVDSVAAPPRRRVATRPTRASRERRLDTKTRRAQVKSGRAKVAV
jgi:ribosome-associated protein